MLLVAREAELTGEKIDGVGSFFELDGIFEDGLGQHLQIVVVVKFEAVKLTLPFETLG